MSSTLDYFVLDKKEEIMEAAQDFAFVNADRRENPDGSYHGWMTIHDHKVFNNYEEAIEGIDNLTKGSYDDHAVRFYDTRNLSNKTIENLEDRYQKLILNERDYNEKNRIQNRKSKSITCKSCDSKLTLEYLRHQTCPVCHSHLRSDTVLERLRKYRNDKVELQERIVKEKQKLFEKAEIKWMAKVHVRC